MKWAKNLESIAKNEGSGFCPYCGNNDTDFGYQLVDQKSEMGYGAIWCNNCKNAFHISRIRITDKTNIKSIPNDLIF